MLLSSIIKFSDFNIYRLILIIIVLSLNCYGHISNESKKDSLMYNELEYYLKQNILDTWYPRIIDQENGGYYSIYDREWNLISPFPKMIVHQTRCLWTAAKAARRYPDVKKFVRAAAHGYDFLKNKAWDKNYGGFFQIVIAEDPAKRQTFKTAYGNAFGIYALSAYYQLSGKDEVLNLAKETFYWLEQYCHDKEYGGYFNYRNRKGESFEETDQFTDTTVHQENWPYYKYKDYNSTIHLMEAFTALYKLWPDSLLKDRLQELFLIVRDKIINKKGYLEMHFDREWNHISLDNYNRQKVIANSWLDHVSFGHDMETAFLLLETESVLKNKYSSSTYKVAEKLMNHSIENGFDKNYSGIFYEGFYFAEDSITIINRDKEWWPQAEGINALLMMSYLEKSSELYKKVFYDLWDFIKKYQIDTVYGGWYRKSIDQDPQENRKLTKAGPWKSCYHTYRAISQSMAMLKHNKPIFEIDKK